MYQTLLEKGKITCEEQPFSSLKIFLDITEALLFSLQWARCSCVCDRWADNLLSQQVLNTSGFPVIAKLGSLNACNGLYQVTYPALCQACSEWWHKQKAWKIHQFKALIMLWSQLHLIFDAHPTGCLQTASNCLQQSSKIMDCPQKNPSLHEIFNECFMSGRLVPSQFMCFLLLWYSKLLHLVEDRGNTIVGPPGVKEWL